MPIISRESRWEYWVFSQHYLAVLTSLPTSLLLTVLMTAISHSSFSKRVRVSLTSMTDQQFVSPVWLQSSEIVVLIQVWLVCSAQLMYEYHLFSLIRFSTKLTKYFYLQDSLNVELLCRL